MAGGSLLTGYKVLDFTQIVAGTTTTKLMAEMGAEVIKVEQAPKGDPARLNPVIRKGRSAYFMQHNLGKQSLCVNLKDYETKPERSRMIQAANSSHPK